MAATNSQTVIPILRKDPKRSWLQPISNRFHWFMDVPPEHLNNMTPERARLLTLDAIEDGTNDFIVVLVAASGFFTDSYILFATNAILPMLEYVYWNSSTMPRYGLEINCATLAGCVCGMVAFGYLGDKFGRRKLYGVVLMMLIGGTLGLIMSSPGYTPIDDLQGQTAADIDWTKTGSMNVLAWLIFWRFVSGVGIGGDYPLSAIMVSEMAPTKKRARMLATLFSMQAFGYAAATVTSIVVVKTVQHYHPTPAPIWIDQTWRWVMGLGLIPASVATFMRCFVPESPRFTLYVLNYPFRALQEADRLNQAGVQYRYQQQYEDQAIRRFGQPKRSRSQNSDSSGIPQEEFEFREPARVSVRRKRNSITLRKFWRYLRKGGNVTALFATASTWFLLDFTFYGLGFNTPQSLAKIWEGAIPLNNGQRVPIWDTNWGANHPDPEVDIYNILITENTRSLLTSSIGAIVGALLLIFTVEHFNRKRLQYLGFGILTALFIIIGASYYRTVDGDHAATITLYAITQLCYYMGPNALTFVIAAELFPTRFRCTCHGISAAMGKLGSIFVQLVLAYSKVPGHKYLVSSPQSIWLGWILLMFALPMLIGGIITWRLLGELQEKSASTSRKWWTAWRNLPLEDLAEEHREHGRRKVSEATMTTNRTSHSEV